MTGSGFFLRSRGRVSGPFDVEGLRRLVRQGTLSRIHEISADRVTWSPAADYEELFPARPAPPAATAPEAEPALPPPRTADADGDPFAFVGQPPPPAGETGGAAGDLRYYYSQNGAAVGPISVSVLKLLAQNGTLSAGDLVWRENAEVGVPAARIPALASFFSAGYAPAWPPAPAPARPAPLSYAQAQIRHGAAERFGAAARVVGIVGGATLLLCLLPPWFSEGRQTFWWWDLYRAPAAGAWAACCTYLTMAGVALCILSPLTRGLARGIAMVSLGGVAFFFLIGALLDGDAVGGPAFGVLVPVALAALLGVCSFRAAAPESTAGRVMLGVCGGVVTLGLLTWGILWASRNTSITGAAPGAVVLGLVMVVVGAIAGLAAGVMAFVGLKPRFTPELNRATWACALGGLALPGVGMFVACLGAFGAFAGAVSSSPSWFGSAAEDLRVFIVLAMLRALLLWGSLLGVSAAGLAELMLAASGGQARRAGRG